MPDFTDHGKVLKLLTEAQDAESDMRELAKEDDLFITKEDGQYDTFLTNATDGKPRYTFDMTSPIIDQIGGDIEQSDFDIKIRPASADATKEGAKLRDGMVRSIETMSNAQSIYANAGKNMSAVGIDGWMVVSDFVDDNSFDTDILVKPIHNFIERVWFINGSQEQSRADSEGGFLLSAIPVDKYDKRWPEGSRLSVSQGNKDSAYYDKAETVIIGHFFHRVQKERTLVKTSTGRVFVEDDIKSVEDELADSGETIVDSRKVKDNKFHVRKFDGGDWLEEAEETPFSYIPLVPVYGNFKVIENKPVYHGAVRKLKDPQRVLNYSLSREIEECAFAPRAKYWMTDKQIKGHEDKLATMNTNADPVQRYNVDPDAPGTPQQNGGAQVNQGLRNISDGMQQLMGRSAGIFAAGMGDDPNAQSGVAIEKLQDKSNNITEKYFKSLEIAICQTGKIIVDALPIVYDTQRQRRIVGQDGTEEIEEINQTVIDEETGQPVVLNDLTQGKYDVVCTAGPSYHSRQQETVDGVMQLGTVMPEILQTGADIILNQISTPGIEDFAARVRKQRFEAGIIPEDQMTEDEKEILAQQAQQPEQPDPNLALAQAEMAKAEAEHQANQVAMAKAQGEFALKQQQLQIEASRAQLEGAKVQLQAREQELKLAEKEADLGLKRDQQQFNQIMDQVNMNNQMLNDGSKRLNMEADTWNKIREAMGVDTVVSPTGAAAYQNQAENILDDQT